MMERPGEKTSIFKRVAPLLFTSILAITGCKRLEIVETMQNPGLTDIPKDANIKQASQKQKAENGTIREGCKLILKDITKLQRGVEDLHDILEKEIATIRAINKGKTLDDGSKNNPSNEQVISDTEEFNDKWQDAHEEVLNAVNYLSDCEFNNEDALKSFLSKLSNSELINLIKAINSGKNKYLKMNFDIDGIENMKFELPSLVDTNEGLIINRALETILERGVENEEIEAFFDLADLVDLLSGEQSYLNDENTRRFKKTCIDLLRKKFDTEGDLEIDYIEVAEVFDTELASILFNLIYITKDLEKLKAIIESLAEIAEKDPETHLKLKNYLWAEIGNPNNLEDKKITLLQGLMHRDYKNRQFTLINKENIPTLVLMIKKDSPKVSESAIYAFEKASQLDLVDEKTTEEIAKFLLERGKKENNVNACLDLRKALDWYRSLNTERTEELANRVCQPK